MKPLTRNMLCHYTYLSDIYNEGMKGGVCMSSIVIFNDEYLCITIENKDVFVETFKKDFPMEKLPFLLSQHPEIGREASPSESLF